MDFNLVTLEVADLITHFDYFNNLVSDALVKPNKAALEDQTKIRNKSQEHLSDFLSGVQFYNSKKQLKSVTELKDVLATKLKSMEAKEIHELIEKLEKDAKKIRKLYKSLTKK